MGKGEAEEGGGEWQKLINAKTLSYLSGQFSFTKGGERL